MTTDVAFEVWWARLVSSLRLDNPALTAARRDALHASVIGDLFDSAAWPHGDYRVGLRRRSF